MVFRTVVYSGGFARASEAGIAKDGRGKLSFESFCEEFVEAAFQRCAGLGYQQVQRVLFSYHGQRLSIFFVSTTNFVEFSYNYNPFHDRCTIWGKINEFLLGCWHSESIPRVDEDKNNSPFSYSFVR